MHLLPPQVELDPALFMLTLMALGIAWLVCKVSSHNDVGRRNTPNARLRP
jgi:hypothetical protein